MFVGKGEGRGGERGGEGRGVAGVGQGFWPSLVAPHEDLPWSMIIFNCLIRFSSLLYFTLALTGKTRFGWALATPLFTCHILEHNIILWSRYSIPNSPTQISPRSLCHLGTFAIFFNLVKFKGGCLTFYCLLMLFFSTQH
jgi:hypothetical protein